MHIMWAAWARRNSADVCKFQPLSELNGWMDSISDCDCHCHLNRRKAVMLMQLWRFIYFSIFFFLPANATINVRLNNTQWSSGVAEVEYPPETCFMHFSPSHLIILLRRCLPSPAKTTTAESSSLSSGLTSRGSAEVHRSAYFKFCTSSPLLTYLSLHILPPLHSLNVYFLSGSN